MAGKAILLPNDLAAGADASDLQTELCRRTRDVEADFLARLIAEPVCVALNRGPLLRLRQKRRQGLEKRLGLPHKSQVRGMRTVHRGLPIAAQQFVAGQVVDAPRLIRDQLFKYSPQGRAT